MVPDVYHGTIKGKKITEIINDKDWLTGEFITLVQKRAGVILKMMHFTVTLSAAVAITDHLREWYHGTKKGTISSMGFVSDGSYNIPEGIVCSRPVQCLGNFQVEFVNDLKLNSTEEIGLKKTC
jgi:malate dehydrogenase